MPDTTLVGQLNLLQGEIEELRNFVNTGGKPTPAQFGQIELILKNALHLAKE